MRYGSVCSGIEAASVAWGPLGWWPAFFAEIDPFACSVLSHRFPGVSNLGDFTAIGGDAGPIDLLVGGTPCQSFSVAGLRKGLGDDRGNLALEYLRLAGRLRARWVVWENVPGVLSSNRGRDFGAFLGGLAELGYGFAYRVLDAQYVRVGGFRRAVPQRRRRVFVVGHLGDWRRAVAVLFDRESLSGNPPPRRGAGPGFTFDAAPCLTSSGRGVARTGESRGQDPLVAVADCAPAITSNPYGDHESREGLLVAHTPPVACTLAASDGGASSGYHPVVPVAFSFDGRQITSNVNRTTVGPDRPCGTLHEMPHAVAYQCHGTNVGPMGTLRSGNGNVTGGVPFIVNAAESCAKLSHARVASVARCIDSCGSFANAQGGTVVATRWAVRRLTPRECERLQGIPDDWTLVPHRGKPAADGPRYKAIGNSMAVNCMRWIGERIELVEQVTRWA